MRDKRFVAEHRGGPLNIVQHRQLMRWAIKCSEDVLPLFRDEGKEALKNSLQVAKAWEYGTASVGDARKAAVAAIPVAGTASDPAGIAVARSVGHAVATAHMADHALGASLYALKAVKLAGKSVAEEKARQDEILPPEIRELVLTSRNSKERHFKI